MKKLYLVLILLLGFFSTSIADEGMWLPSLIQKLNIGEMQKMGCELSADQIYNINNSSLKDAVVALDHGSCTAELISKDGLLLTNHHCGFGEIQAHSTVEHDYLKDGFWAQSRDEELSNPGKTVSFLISAEDVTGKVLEGVSDTMSYNERNQLIRANSREIANEAEKDTHYDANVQSMFSSNKFYLFISETFRDVRLVGCPPKSLGKFGGDTDNWMWPRHTADFCLFRVYAGPDGKPADYSKDNIPLTPKSFLPISLKGVKEGDFSMILGFPGRTNRYETSTAIKYTMQIANPVRIQVRGKKLSIIKNYMETSQKAQIQYSSKYAISSNYYKYSIGQNNGLKRLNVLAQKEAIEDEFTKWVNEDETRKEKYGKALALIKAGYSDPSAEVAKEYMVEAMIRGPEIFMFAKRARLLYELLEDPKKNESRIERMTEALKKGHDRYFRNYDAETDREIVSSLLKLYNDNVDPLYYPSFFAEVKSKYKGNFDKFATKMFEKTIFADKAKFEDFLDSPDLKTLKKDMAFKSSISIFQEFNNISSIIDQTKPLRNKGERLFLAGLMEMDKGKKFYPDANSTMRLTYGKVLDYDPRDGVRYKYYTTLKGYIEKEIPGDMEFDVPKKLKELYAAGDYGDYADEDGTLHTCFITNNDITGGNSGSPVMNGRGELIGVAFDGNWEAMSGDIAFEPELQRCINVDIRYVLWVIDKFAGASHLIDEMKIIR